MGTRHEQVQAHRFVTRRIVSALLSGEPETTERPMRRLALSLFGGVIVAAIVFAVVGIYGFLNPAGGKADNGDLVIMRETGARFAMVEGTLHPVLNWSSALLFAGSPSPRVKQMSRRSLAAFPVGDPIGIPGAPDPPPDKKSLLGVPWTLCSVPGIEGSETPTTHLLVGRTPAGGTLPGETTLLLTTGRGGSQQRFLLWQDRLYEIKDPSTLTALDLAAAPTYPVATQLVNGITRGPDLVPPDIAGKGQQSAIRLAGSPGVIGRVYRSGQSSYVLTTKGLAPIGDVTARLLTISDRAVEITAGEAANLAEKIEPEGFPTALPKVSTGRNDLSMVCSTFRGDERNGKISTVVGYQAAGSESLAIPPSTNQNVSADGILAVDRVLVEHGRGAVVREQPVPGVNANGTVYLITDLGIRYALKDSGQVRAQEALGFAGYAPVPVPAQLLALVPSGPTLDPAAAGQFFRPTPAGPTPSGGNGSGGGAGTPTPPPSPTPSRSPTPPSAAPSSSPPSRSAPAASSSR
ncbi:type VII secretion protein EccB [Virgisporangium aliadipatigenens]|uniref:Type VII secretion protein EccB n=1 Tax=Virgisporangium aliadipatigenens TaxID=741659 RepID=A0A8J3YQ11_9ACTN|nr:type VII secretion protein EccB [Virgisporangium aliadipatigenens]GIJ49684.1 type VII secretion protein EccB [Virgisporangium aliadipatigenens]